MEEGTELNFVNHQHRENTMIINTNTTCFLCLNDAVSYTRVGDNCSIKVEQEVEPDTFSLRAVCRYLNINIKDLFTAWSDFSTGPENECLDHMSNFEVTLCRQCSSVISKLSGLCLELEMIKMKVEDCLRSFTEILQDSEQEGGRLEHLRALVTAGMMEPVQWDKAEVLRTELKKKCYARIRCGVPKVDMTDSTPVPSKPVISAVKTIQTENYRTQVPVSRPIVPKYAASKSSTTNATTPILPISVMVPGNQQVFQIPAQVIQSLAPNETISIQPAPKMNVRTRQVMCDLCHPPRPYKLKEMKRHKIHKHLETFFAALKSPNLNMTEFKEFCDYVIQVEMISAKTVKNEDGNPACQCPNCPNVYNNHPSLRYHIYSVHEELLGRKIVELQRSTSVEEIRAIELPTTSFSAEDKWTCPECGAKFSHSSNLWKHRTRGCGNIKTHKRRVRTHCKFKCDICGKSMKMKNSLDRHRKEIHGIEEVPESRPLLMTINPPESLEISEVEEEEYEYNVTIDKTEYGNSNDDMEDNAWTPIDDMEEDEEVELELPQNQRIFMNGEAISDNSGEDDDDVMVIVPHESETRWASKR